MIASNANFILRKKVEGNNAQQRERERKKRARKNERKR